MTQKRDLVLGAGGIKGYGHIGALQAIREFGVDIGTVTGVSVGAGVAALYTNGYSPEQILASFRSGRARMIDPALWMSAFRVPNVMQWLVSQSFTSLEGPWRQQVEHYGLRPNDQLQILAHDVRNGRPVLFRGTDYDLAKAIAASGSVPGAFVPVEHEGSLLVDGALYHYNPTVFSQAPAIVVRLGRAKQWPTEPLTPFDMYYHFREMYLPLLPTHTDVDEDKHILIDIPCEDIAGLSFGASERRCLRLVDEGYEAARVALQRAIDNGKLVTTSGGAASRS